MSIDDELTTAFDRGFRLGVDALSPRERDLYYTQYFIIEYETGGLTGYLYNQHNNIAQIDLTIESMRRLGASALANLLAEAVEFFRDYKPGPEQTTWAQVLQTRDPAGRFKQIHAALRALQNYGLESPSPE